MMDGSLEDQIQTISKQYRLLESRLEALEFKSSASHLEGVIDKVEGSVKRAFEEVPIIASISYRTSSTGLTLVIVHDSSDISQALEQIQKAVSNLENAYPNIYFEQWVLHVDEVQDEHLQRSKMIFRR